MIRILTLTLLTIILSQPSLYAAPDAGGIQHVTTVGPSWNKFTNRDGTGLYHDIFKAVFTPLNITVTHVYMPSARAYEMLILGTADIMACSAHVEPQLQLAACPMFQNQYHAFFSKKNIHPWRGRKSLNGHSLVWRRGYYTADEFKDLHELTFAEHSSGSTALGMVVLGRTDFYIDDINLIRENLDGCTLKFDMKDFDIKPVGRRSYYPMFAQTRHGTHLKNLFDSRMKNLHKQGVLRKIFNKWEFSYPDYDCVPQ